MWGNLESIDALQSRFESVQDYPGGLDGLRDQLQAYLDVHNNRVRDMFADLVMTTDNKDDVFGSVDTMEMSKIGEYGRVNVQKPRGGVIVGFPLETWSIATGWTYKYLKNAMVSEITNAFLALRTADAERITREVKRALFSPTNYTFNDHTVNRRTAFPLQVRRLVNADGNPLPPSPEGATFNAGTHTHYLAQTTLDAAGMQALIDTVTEHYEDGETRVYINKAQRTAVSALAGFIRYDWPNLVPANNAASYPSPRRNPMRTFDQAVGTFNGIEVWVKPWMPANYLFCFTVGPESRKPLRRRVRSLNDQDLQRVDQAAEHPLFAETYEREMGFGVAERTNGAVLMLGDTTYAAPTLAA